MKILKNSILVLSIVVLVFMIFMFIASFSYKNIYYNKEDDSAIIINENKYKYTKNNKEIDGTIEIADGQIQLISEIKTKATMIYRNKDKIIRITGEIGKNAYTNGKFKQICSIWEYFQAIF